MSTTGLDVIEGSERLTGVVAKALHAARHGGGDDLHAHLYQLYQSLSDALADAAGAEDDARCDALTEQQGAIIDAAARLPADTLPALAYKMALWRWDNEDLGDEREVTRGERVALAALADVCRLSGNEHILP